MNRRKILNFYGNQFVLSTNVLLELGESTDEEIYAHLRNKWGSMSDSLTLNDLRMIIDNQWIKGIDELLERLYTHLDI